MKTTILIHEWVTGGGLAGLDLPRSWAKEGTAMRRAIARDFASIQSVPTRVIVTLDRRLPDAPGPWEVVRIGEGEELAKVQDLASQADFTLIVAPETKGVLHGWGVELKRLGLRSLGSKPEAIRIAGDKIRFAECLLSHGLATPATRPIAEYPKLPIDAEYPAILKPIDGAGGLETYLIDGPRWSGMPAESSSAFLLQPQVPGDPLSASFLVDQKGIAHRIAIGRQQIEIRGNRLAYLGGELPYQQSVDEKPLVAAIAAIPGLGGFVGVDFIRDRQTGATTVIEINPRLTTSCVGICHLLPAGLLAQAWLAACGGPGPDRPEVFREIADAIAGREPISFAADGTILPGVDEVS